MSHPKRLAILGKPESWHVQQLASAATKLGITPKVAPFEQLVGGIGKESRLSVGDVNLLDFDAVFVRGIPPGTLEQVVFRMDALHRLERAGVVVINPPRAIETCVDKYLATSLLSQVVLPTPRTIVCESLDEAMSAFAELGGHVVVKPIFGSEGRGMIELTDESIAYRVLRSLAVVGSILYLQEFIEHPGYDVRLLVVDGRVIAGMKRWGQSDFRTNASRGGKCEAYVPSDEECSLAISATQAVGALIAGIDLIEDRAGGRYVLEANSTPGFQALVACTGIDVAREMVSTALQSLPTTCPSPRLRGEELG